MSPSIIQQHRLQRSLSPSIKTWDKNFLKELPKSRQNIVLNCGWGRLLLGHTFKEQEKLANELRKEKEGQRDIAFYIRDPHVLTAYAPQEFFLDPSHTYRIWFDKSNIKTETPKGFSIRKVKDENDIEGINNIYKERKMIPLSESFFKKKRLKRTFVLLVAECEKTKKILGTTMGIDHYYAFRDPEKGSSMWELAVDSQAPYPGIGLALVCHLIDVFIGRGRNFMDLSVMHDNKQAISLYEKLGFERVPVFCVKRKTPANEKLFIGPEPEKKLNQYAQIIINEARKRGIGIDIKNEENNVFKLEYGGRSITCYESLTELTNSIALKRCEDKSITNRLLKKENINVPEQIVITNVNDEKAVDFLKKHKSIVVKPIDSEQGKGITMDVKTQEEFKKAVLAAKKISSKIILEQYIKGKHIRIHVIDFKFVTADLHTPPSIIGTGKHTIKNLIKKQSRRRSAATNGESKIPLDNETKKCVKKSGYKLDEILPKGKSIDVRKTTNEHTGAKVIDVSSKINPYLKRIAEKAAKTLEIPVVGFDFIVKSLNKSDYHIIEANERPGLDYDIQAKALIDFLFPQTKI